MPGSAGPVAVVSSSPDDITIVSATWNFLRRSVDVTLRVAELVRPEAGEIVVTPTNLAVPMPKGSWKNLVIEYTYRGAAHSLTLNGEQKLSYMVLVDNASGVSVPAASTPAPKTLSEPQMAEIVLIEGDKGVATGFITRVHDTDCVVTNLHVLLDNEKITVKDLTGAVLEVHGIIGAVGADIALLRLTKPLTKPSSLVTADNVLQSAKIGDHVVVVGDQLGGGVATQITGQVKGIGPDRVEVDAAFHPGNSGSPIFDLNSQEVVGVAAFTHLMTVDLNSNPADAASQTNPGVKTETRWFGYRIDSVAKWESIDPAKWRSQANQVDDFRATSIALWNAYQGNLPAAGQNPRLRSLIERFESRTAGTPDELAGDFIRSVLAYAAEGEKGFANADYYDYFHTNLDWATSVPDQVAYRNLLIKGFNEIENSLPSYRVRLKR